MQKIFENGGRKLWLIGGVIMLAYLNEAIGLGVSSETIKHCLYAAVGGSGTIALEDGLRALFKKEER